MSEPGISINRAVFRQEIVAHLVAIDRICVRWKVSMHKHTLILRDPSNDHMSLVLTNEDDLNEVFRVVKALEEGTPE